VAESHCVEGLELGLCEGGGRLNWGPPAEPDIEQLVALAPQLVRLVEVNVVRPLEMRAILRDLFNLEMIEKGEPELTES
jgi:hypothetical protein